MAEVKSIPPVEEAEWRKREAFYYRVFAAALCIAAMGFGLLNLWGIIKM
jgi:hypothetical protein